MRTTLKFTAIITAIAAIMVCVIMLFMPSVSINGEEEPKSKYTVREHEGKIAIFKNNSDKPIELLEIYVDELPLKDRQLLKAGIKANDDSELNSIIEDYDG